MYNPKKLFIFIFLVSMLQSGFFFADAEPAKQKSTMHIGHMANTFAAIDRRDANLALGIIVEKLMVKMFPGYKPSNVIFPNLKAALDEIDADRVDILTIMSIDYIKIRSQVNMEPGFVSGWEGEILDQYLLLVQKDGKFKALNQLKNKTIAVEKGGSGTIALMWLDTLLLESSLPESATFLRSVKKVDKVSRAVLPVFFGQVDACIVPKRIYQTIVELNPQVNKKLFILSESPGFLVTVTCFHSNLEERIKNAIMNFPETITESTEGKQILAIFRTKKITKYKPEYLVNIEKLYKKYRALKAKVPKKQLQ